jgi:hypothetical protein
MTQPQPNQRPFPGGGGDHSDWSIADAARVLQARQEGPRSPVLPVLPFATSGAPCDLATVVDLLLASSSKDPSGGVTLAQMLVCSTALLQRAVDATSGNSASIKLMIIDPKTGDRSPAAHTASVTERRMMQEFSMVTSMVCNALEGLVAPLVSAYLTERGFDPSACSSPAELAEQASRLLTGDRILEALQITRQELEAASTPPVDS